MLGGLALGCHTLQLGMMPVYASLSCNKFGDSPWVACLPFWGFGALCG